MAFPAVPNPSHPPTIGMLTARLSGPTEINLWHGVADQARARGANLICFSGGIPRSRQEYEEQKNILFNMAGKHNVDGLLVWANILSHTLDRSSLETFCQRYAPLPMISMGVVMPAIPSIRIDMRAGMRRLLSHLIDDHGCRKIAFIRGPEVSQDAEERYQAYLETLAAYSLALDPGLIMPGDFGRSSGKAAIQQLADAHRMDFDALVSANDNMAIGALQALQARGILVPDDVLVAGFDDIEETRAVAPLLTTVRAPWHILGSKSIDLLLARIAGTPLPEQVFLQTELVRRQSCGCKPAKSEARDDPRESHRTEPGSLEMFQGLGGPSGESFKAEVQGREGSAGRFIACLGEALSQAPSGAEIIEWQNTLDAFRTQVNHLAQNDSEKVKAHELLESGYALVGEMAHRRQLGQRLEAEDQTGRLNRIVQSMATTYDVETLMKLLAQELPGLGIQTCFLSLYDEKGSNPAWSRLILACAGSERLPLEPGGRRFLTSRLVPDGMLPQNRPFAYDVEALYFKNEPIGFVLFEIGPRDGEVYTALRGHLSSALKSASLVQAALDAETKAVKADQLKTHLLANVSHELRSPINIIMGLSQMGTAKPNPYGIELPDQLTHDLEHIYESGEHLVRLINDLLDMSRAEIGELDLYFEPVATRSLLIETFETFIHSTSNKTKNLAFTLQVPEHLPILQADPVRLRQILMNLLSNAFKFTLRGQITLGAEVDFPHFHFWVADTGTGISPELQERIFEPFIKAEPPGLHRSGIGLGLSITRRLVALHGGSITLDSAPGQGSTFHVYLPLPGMASRAAATSASSTVEKLPVLLWVSSQKEPAAYILDLCRKSGSQPAWMSSIEALETVVRQGKPVALAWDLDNARPGDWSIIQKLRSYTQFCQLPLLLFQEKKAGKPEEGARVTHVLLKPAGQGTLNHILDLLPQARPHGEIWIVDDDQQVLKYYQQVLTETLSDFFIRPVQGGKEAIELLNESTPDLVLLDLMMPEVDGFQVLEYLRSKLETAVIPVIILTGKMLTYEDVKRLDFPRVALQTKGVLSGEESTAEVQRALAAPNLLPQPTRGLVKQAYVYIQQNYGRAFSLQELSETLGVSKSYLSRIFKMEAGLSLWDYLNRFRIQKAKERLVLSDESITEIAAAVGFEDVGYFGRVFRETAGCSPRAYKQQAQAAKAA
jgi:signal transduction histidine kinase/DNA-binding LacI/PurR family transcriptional regulator/AraC-like DNA-binding protein